ncbi:MAG: glycosyltransferase, partial [Gammaproteobacteria bacterium]|nr:glycosyltransferase [Gammaproteobacteria bacterium]
MENLLIPFLPGEVPDAEVILVVSPHPDDEVFGCGGAIMRHLQNGKQVNVVIISDGAFGTEGEEKVRRVAQRESESCKAAKILGYGKPLFWRLPDRSVIYQEKLIQRLLDVIQDCGASLVYSPAPLEMHPDHRAVAMCVIEAVRRLNSGHFLALYEVGVPLTPNLLLDISDLAEKKKKAMECFVSQNGNQRYDLDIAALNRYRTYTLPIEVTAAEAFTVVAVEELKNDLFRFYQPEYKRQKKLGLILDVKDRPLVSVIIRSLNRFTLSEALDSIALQTYANIEVIVINATGGIHYPLGEWCGNFPLQLLNTEEALRRSAAGNLGLKNARGDYLIFLDDDDWFMPDHIELLVNALVRNTEIKVAYSSVKGVDNQKTQVCSFREPFDRILLLLGNYIPIHAALFSRSIIDAGCLLDESLDLYEDWDFWLQCASYSDFIYIDSLSACYRITTESGQSLYPDTLVAKKISSDLFAKWHNELSRRDFLNFTNRCNTLKENLNTAVADRDEAVISRDQIQAERSWLGIRFFEAEANYVKSTMELGGIKSEHNGLKVKLSEIESERDDLKVNLTESESERDDLKVNLTESESERDDLKV